MRLAFAALAPMIATPAVASMPALSEKPRPATLRTCQIWADKQSADVLEVWGTEESGKSSQSVATSRLVSACMGGKVPEVVGVYSSVGALDAYCARHRETGLCIAIRAGRDPNE